MGNPSSTREVILRRESFGALEYDFSTRRLSILRTREAPEGPSNVSSFLSQGLSAPICLTWELTYACNLSCAHCLSSSGRRDARELDTAACLDVVDQIADAGVFYANIGGGEPTYRRDFKEIVSHALDRRVGIKFSTNGSFLDTELASWVASTSYLDVQVSLDGPDAATNDSIRGEGSFTTAIRALTNLSEAGATDFKISVVVTKRCIERLDELLALAVRFGASLRLTRLRPSGRGAITWEALRLNDGQQRYLYDWLRAHPDVLTGDSFFHLSGYGEKMSGLSMCGAGKVVCLIDPIGDLYACPFTIHPEFRAGSLSDMSFREIWESSPLFRDLREVPGPTSCSSCTAFASCQGGCLAAKFFNGSALSDPDPECVLGHGGTRLPTSMYRPAPDLSHSAKVQFGPTRHLKSS